MYSRRRHSKPVELAFRDKPESYQAAYRNLVRVFIDDNLTEAFIDRLMPFSQSSPAISTPSPAIGSEISRASSRPSTMSGHFDTASKSSAITSSPSSVSISTPPEFIKLQIVTDSRDTRNVETYSISTEFSFNDIAKQLIQGFSNFVDNVLKPKSGKADELKRRYKEKKYLPLNLTKIQQAALNSKEWTGEENPLDKPIKDNKGLLQYFLQKRKPEAFMSPEADNDKSFQKITTGFEDLQVRVTYGNPTFDKIVTMRKSDFDGKKLWEKIEDKLGFDISKKISLSNKHNDSEDLESVVLTQTFPVRITVQIYTKTENEDDKGITYLTAFYSDASKYEIIGYFVNENLEIIDQPRTFRELKDTDPMFKLNQNLFEDNILLFTVKSA